MTENQTGNPMFRDGKIHIRGGLVGVRPHPLPWPALNDIPPQDLDGKGGWSAWHECCGLVLLPQADYELARASVNALQGIPDPADWRRIAEAAIALADHAVKIGFNATKAFELKAAYRAAKGEQPERAK